MIRKILNTGLKIVVILLTLIVFVYYLTYTSDFWNVLREKITIPKDLAFLSTAILANIINFQIGFYILKDKSKKISKLWNFVVILLFVIIAVTIILLFFNHTEKFKEFVVISTVGIFIALRVIYMKYLNRT